MHYQNSVDKQIIEFQNANFSYDLKEVFHNMNMEIKQGELVGLFGENGSGKSTLFKLIMGDLKLTSGIFMRVSNFSIGYLGQSDREMVKGSPLNVYEFLMMYTKAHYPKKKGYERKQFVLDLLKKYDCSELTLHQLKELSGGQLQKVMILKSILHNPNLLLLDEPLSALDEQNKKAVIKMVKQLSSEHKTIFIILHDLEELEQLCARVLICERQQIKNVGTAYA